MPSPLISNQRLLNKDNTGESDGDLSTPILAELTLVSNSPRDSLRHPNSPPLPTRSTNFQSLGTLLAVWNQKFPAYRMMKLSGDSMPTRGFQDKWANYNLQIRESLQEIRTSPPGSRGNKTVWCGLVWLTRPQSPSKLPK